MITGIKHMAIAVRDVNTAIDRRDFHQEDVAGVLEAMGKFDAILAVLTDDDEEKLRRLGLGPKVSEIGDREIELLVQERQEARQRRDFRRADDIRQQLAGHGIILEDTRDGAVRWKRK